MIEEEVQIIKVEPAIIARTENVARKNYKIANWLKVLSMYLENQCHDMADSIIRNEIHENFVMQQGFWENQIKRKFSKPVLTHEDFDFLMLALDDGPYFNAAAQIARRVLKEYKEGQKKLNFTLSILEKIVNLFNHDKKNGSQFYKFLREVYEKTDNVKKQRECFEREMKQAFDDFDITYDEYKLWEKDTVYIQKMKDLYENSKKKWETQTIDFDETRLSKLNVRRSLLELQYKNVMDEKQSIDWLELLPTQAEKLWFLRRWVLNYRQMIPYYLMKCELCYSSDQEKIITKYRVAIRLSESNLKIQQKYIYFLARRINKHLIMPEQLDEDYSSTWGDKVAFFREEINALITKERKLTTSAEQENLYNRYYKLWIQVEESIVKDKDTVCKLYQNIIKNKKDKDNYGDYQAYAKSLIQLNAFKDAKNVLKRYCYHTKSQQSKNALQKFVGIYGNIEDQIQLYTEQRVQAHKQSDPLAIQVQAANKDTLEEKPTAHLQNGGNIADKESSENILPPKRQRNRQLDAVQQKIEAGLRKKLHVDSEETVFMKGIPINWSQSDVLSVLKLPNHVSSVRMVVKNGIQKDYCYIQFDSKQSADEQIKTNSSGYSLKISRPPADYDESKTLFICALPQTATPEKIRYLFSTFGDHIIDIRMKLEKDKNYAYVEFDTKESKQAAFTGIPHQNLQIDLKKVLVQHCDSSRQKNKKFTQVIFLKHLPYKAVEKDVQDFFKNMKTTNIVIPRNDDGKSKGFAYVEFEKFKDYQTALDMQKGSLFGRQFQILKSDRQITLSSQSKPVHHSGDNKSENRTEKKPRHRSNNKRPSKQQQGGEQNKGNNYFSSLFK